MSPLTDQDIGELDNWLRSSIIQLAWGSFTPQTPQAQRQETIDSAMRLAAATSIFTPIGVQMLSTLDGWARIIWAGMRRNHSDLKVEDVRGWFSDVAALEQARIEFDRINPHGEDDVKKKVSSPTSP